MVNLKFEIDSKGIAETFGELKVNVQKDIQTSVESLANMTHARVMELARDNLGSLSKKYMEGVSFSNPEPNFWIVSLDEKLLWVEEGRKSGSMVDDLLRTGAKTSKDGYKYKVIPFEHSKNPTEQSEKAQKLANEIKAVFKERGISWKKIEYDKSGSPRLGKIHSMNIESGRPTPKSKYPALHGVAVYQTKKPGGGISRDVMTFRIVSEKHKAEGKWVYPGRQGDKLLDKAFSWAMDVFDREILPAIFEKYK